MVANSVMHAIYRIRTEVYVISSSPTSNYKWMIINMTVNVSRLNIQEGIDNTDVEFLS